MKLYQVFGASELNLEDWWDKVSGGEEMGTVYARDCHEAMQLMFECDNMHDRYIEDESGAQFFKSNEIVATLFVINESLVVSYAKD